jgi:hypothetical protein
MFAGIVSDEGSAYVRLLKHKLESDAFDSLSDDGISIDHVPCEQELFIMDEEEEIGTVESDDKKLESLATIEEQAEDFYV